MDEQCKLEKWAKTWEKAGNALQAVRKEMLCDVNYYEKNKALLNSMLQYAYEHRVERKTSGLVIMQKYFMQIHRQMMEESTE